MSDIYAKLVSPTCIIKAPTSAGNLSNYHLMPERLIADGFQKLRLIPCRPNDGKQYQLNYRCVDNEIEPFWVEIIQPKPTFAERRKAGYPPEGEYLDAMVKINSGRPELVEEGKRQLAAYNKACLDNKDNVRKEDEESV